MDSLYADNELAWAAGFLDGEGCFGLFKATGARLHPTTRNAVLSVAQKRRSPLDRLEEMFGGNIHAHRIDGVPRAWLWTVQGEKLAVVIPYLLPYLFLKKREAEIVLAYAQTVKRRGRVAIPEDVLTLRGQLIEEMAAERGGIKA